MTRVRVQPVLDHKIGWLELSPYQTQRLGSQLEGRQVFDFAIVGAGFSGVSVARRLAELHPNATIAIIEALRVGRGSAGRNSGYLVDLPLFSGTGTPSSKTALEKHKLLRFGLRQLQEQVEDRGLDVGWSQTGKYAAAREPGNCALLKPYRETLDALNEPYEMLGSTELSRRLGTDFYAEAIFTNGMVVVNPASLIIGLAKSLPVNVTVFENSPLRVVKLKGDRRLFSDKGEIIADQIVFAANAYHDALRVSQRRLAPMYTYSCMTRTLSGNEICRFTNKTEYAIRSIAPAGTTLRLTADRRILVRNTVYPSVESGSRVFEKAMQRLRCSFDTRFPDLGNVPFEYRWGGNICLTLNGEEQFVELGNSCFALGGYNGTGIVKSAYLGHYMADFVCGNDSDELAFIRQNTNPPKVPPEPLRKLGASIITSQIEQKAGSDL